jgi:WD40 repeat protein
VDVWDLKNGKLLRTIGAHVDEAVAVNVYKGAEGWRMVCGSLDSTITIWNLDNGMQEQRLTGHERGVTSVAVSATPGRWLAISSSWDGALKAWNLETGEVVATFTADAPLQCCGATRDGKTLVAGDEEGRVHFLELQGF